MLAEFLNLIFPDLCVVCKRGLLTSEKYLCTNCRIRLPNAASEMYLEFPNPLELRFIGHLKIKRAFAFLKFHKSGSAQKILHGLKYQGMSEIGVLLGMWFGLELKESGNANYDLILPVPLHYTRRRKRGYNQSEYICEGISRSIDVKWIGCELSREVATKTQTGFERSQRWKNVEDVFRLRNTIEIKDKRVLLVDDVVTTGATLISCGSVLEKSGVRSLSLACLAMAQ